MLKIFSVKRINIQKIFIRHWDLIIAAVIICALFIIYSLRFENAPSDGASDYLVASHIVKYHEFPLVGPYNSGTNDMIRYSPLYYYLLAGFLYVHNSVYFLGVVNALFLCVTITALHLLAYFAFGRIQALISLVLLGVSPYFIDIARYIWQPHAMTPFVYLSYLFLLLAYTKKKFFFTIISSISMSIALTLHFAVLSVFPLYAVLALFTLRFQKKKFKSAAILIAFTAMTVILLNFSSLSQTIQTPSGNGQLMFLTLPELVMENLLKNLSTLFRVISFERIDHPLAITQHILSVFLFISCLRYSTQMKWAFRYKILLCMTIACLAGLVSASFTRNNFSAYLLPVIGFIPVMLSDILQVAWSKFPMLKVVKIWMIILFTLIPVTSIALNTQWMNHRPSSFNIAAERIAGKVSSEEITGISLNNFQVILYNYENFSNVSQHQNMYISESMMIVPLEKELNTKLVALENKGKRYVQINKMDYVFFVCLHPPTMRYDEKCREDFKRSYGKFLLHESIYSDYLLTVYGASQSSRMDQK